MKNKKILIGVIAVIVVVTIVVVGFTLTKDKEEPITTTEVTTQETTIELTTKIKETETETTQLTEDDTLKIDDVEVKTPTTTKAQKDNSATQKPVNKDENKGDNVGIVINPGAPSPEPSTYSCGVPGHHCHGQATHNFIVSLEQKGCEYCGSHSCPSFYTTDEWGQACVDVTKCPEYDKKKDPIYYCQVCGKPSGVGSNGTCVNFTVDTECPDCGEFVKARTCHSH